MAEQSAALLPQNPDLDISADLAPYYPIVSTLTNIQIKILAEIADDMISGNKRSDVDIAQELNVHYKSVYNARKNPAFGTALGIIVREIVKGKTDNIVANIIEHGKKDWKADKFLLEYTGQFIQRSQQLNIHANMSQTDQPGTLSAIIDEFLINLGASGYPIEKIVQRFHELRSEGAF